jgi:hypothetical protein
MPPGGERPLCPRMLRPGRGDGNRVPAWLIMG